MLCVTAAPGGVSEQSGGWYPPCLIIAYLGEPTSLTADAIGGFIRPAQGALDHDGFAKACRAITQSC